MPSRLRKSSLILTVCILFSSLVWAQRKNTTQIQSRDFSSVDRSNSRTIEYQEFDKRLLTFSTKVQYVLVPVVVTDKAGNPITGLKKENFRLQENGKDQVISSLEEIVPIATPLPSGPANNKNEASNEAAIENKAPRRLAIIAIDFVNTPFSDQLRARRQVISFLAKSLEPDSLYQVVSVEKAGLRILHDYTQNSKDLIATVKRLNSRFTAADKVDQEALRNFSSKTRPEEMGSEVTPGATSVGPSGNAYSLDPRTNMEAWIDAQGAAAEGEYSSFVASQAAESTLTAFQQIAQRTSGIPGRKSLIWITGGFPFSLDPASARISAGINFDVYQHVMQELSDQMIALYPVDARGVLTNNADATMRLRGPQITYSGEMLADASNRQLDILNTMTSFADMTGGRAYINTNDTAGAIHSASLDGAHYYVLSYPVDKSNPHAGWRKISVKAGTYNARARKGYYLTQTTVNPLASARFDIEAAMRSPLDYTGIPLKVVVVKSQVEADGKQKVPFSAVIPGAGVKIDTADNNHVFLEITYAALTPDGKVAAQQNKSYNLNLNSDQVKQFATMGLGFGDSLEVAPGAYRLRVVVRDNLNGRVGSVLADVRAE